MKAITIQEPWASWVASGFKPVENRTRDITGGYRGPVLIHVSRAWKPQMLDEALTFCEQRGIIVSDEQRAVFQPAPATLGKIIGAAEIIACIRPCAARDIFAYEDADFLKRGSVKDFFTWHVGIVLSSARLFTTPLATRGQLGLWNYEGELPAEWNLKAD